MLMLAEQSSQTSVVMIPAHQWIDMAKEFGASPMDAKKAEKAVAARKAEVAEISGEEDDIENESRANPEDAKQAREFLASLPPACGNSRASVAKDGTVVIRISCQGGQGSLAGRVEIKDGIVRSIQ